MEKLQQKEEEEVQERDGEVTVEGRRRSTRETKDCYERRDKDKEKKKQKYKRKDKKIGTK